MDDRLKALVLGGISWNTMVYLDAFPEPKPQTVFARDANATVGSSGAGKAMNLARLGVDVALWGFVGEDPPGQRIREEMASRGIRLLTESDPLGTMRHVNLMDATGERISIFVNAGSDDLPVDHDVVAHLAAEADIVAVTIMNHCRRFLPMLRDLGKPVWVDLHSYDGTDSHHTEFIAAADYLLMSSTAMNDWRGFLEQRVAAGTDAAVCTHGASGASGLSAAEGWVDVPAVPVAEVVDTNGAGDAFFAGFATAWVTGSGLEAAMKSGARTAAEAVQSYDLAPSLTR